MTADPSIPAAPAFSERRRALLKRLIPLGLVLLGAACYADSFGGVFLFDDNAIITENPDIGPDVPFWRVLAAPGHWARPVLFLSLAFNCALGGYDPAGYHAVNLAVHVLAGLTLFGVIRRTLASPRLAERFARDADALAGVVAAVWLAHPLQTGAVTYVVQRAESMMGLFYLLTLYCVLRAAESRNPWRWVVAAWLACAAGMGTKQVAVTVPLVVLLYDRVFLAGSFRAALRRRGIFYAGLAAICGALTAASLWATREDATVGFALKNLTAWQYARTQGGVILHYLRLCFWPRPLVLDYGWPVANTAAEILPGAAAVAVLLAATAWALVRRPAAGFLGAWFFLILVPSSSFLPIRDLAFEHRMYLPLAAVVAAAVLSAYALGCRLPRRVRPGILLGAAGAVVLALGAATLVRNLDYHSEEQMWRNVIAHRPLNIRGHRNLGVVLASRGRNDLALECFLRVLEISPDDAPAANNAGAALTNLDQYSEAARFFRRAIEIDPEYLGTYANLAGLLNQVGLYDQAIEVCRSGLARAPQDASLHRAMGAALTGLYRYEEAATHLSEAMRLQPTPETQAALDRVRKILRKDDGGRS